MASLVDHQRQAKCPPADDLCRVTNHPMFSELQATLATQCQHSTVPYTLVSNEGPGSPEMANTAMIEAELHNEFRKLASLQNDKVAELENFYNTQCVTIETQRNDALADLHARGLTDGAHFNHELKLIHQFHDHQRQHLTTRVSGSLYLLKSNLPKDQDGRPKKSKSRLLSTKAVALMQDWYDNHLENPYPNEDEKKELADLGNISMGQVKAWFANKRNRSLNTKPKRVQTKKIQDRLKALCAVSRENGYKNSHFQPNVTTIIQQLSTLVEHTANIKPVVSHKLPISRNPHNYLSLQTVSR